MDFVIHWVFLALEYSPNVESAFLCRYQRHSLLLHFSWVFKYLPVIQIFPYVHILTVWSSMCLQVRDSHRSWIHTWVLGHFSCQPTDAPGFSARKWGQSILASSEGIHLINTSTYLVLNISRSNKNFNADSWLFIFYRNKSTFSLNRLHIFIICAGILNI